MQVIRQIAEVKNGNLNMKLPRNFVDGKVEVIVLPLYGAKKKAYRKNSEVFSGAISKETAEKLHKHIDSTKIEWDRDIY